MTSKRLIRQILANYSDDCALWDLEDLGGDGGFSGSRLWRIRTPDNGDLCLRRLPAGYPVDRLQFVQAVLWHVDQEGFDLVPVPVETRHDAGYVVWDKAIWELAPWLPGTPDLAVDPSPEKLSSAMTALARFHAAAASFPLPDPVAASPGIIHRQRRLIWLQNTGIAKLHAAVDSGDQSELIEPARRILAYFPALAAPTLRLLAAAAERPVPIQPCIRDIRADHVLFEGERVSGLVDFGAMRPDSVAADVARLLGTSAGDDPLGWHTGLAAYQAIRPLTDSEISLITAFDKSGPLLGGLQWIDWIYREGRQFDDIPAIAMLLDGHLRRLAAR